MVFRFLQKCFEDLFHVHTAAALDQNGISGLDHTFHRRNDFVTIFKCLVLLSGIITS